MSSSFAASSAGGSSGEGVGKRWRSADASSEASSESSSSLSTGLSSSASDTTPSTPPSSKSSIHAGGAIDVSGVPRYSASLSLTSASVLVAASGAAALMGVWGFLTTVLSSAALWYLHLTLVGVGCAVAVVAYVLDERGLIMFLPPALQKQLLDVTLLEWLLADTFGKMVRNAIKDLAPLFLSKDDAERKQCLEHMSRGTKRRLTKKGLAYSLPGPLQRVLLPRTLRKISQRKRNVPNSPVPFKGFEEAPSKASAYSAKALAMRITAMFRRSSEDAAGASPEDDESPFSAAARDRVWKRVWSRRRSEFMNSLPDLGARVLEVMGIRLSALRQFKSTARRTALTCVGLFAIWLALSRKTRRGTLEVMKVAAVRGTTVFASAGVVVALVRLSLYLQKKIVGRSDSGPSSDSSSSSSDDNTAREKLRRASRSAEQFLKSDAFASGSNAAMGGCAAAVAILLTFRAIAGGRKTAKR